MHARTVGFICAAALLASGADARAAPLKFEPCRGTPDYECAALQVPLDPSGSQPGTLSLHVRRLVETRDAPEVLVALAGGPGQSSARFIGDFADVLAEGLENRQLVVLDTRGTGASGALECGALAGLSPGAGAREVAPLVGHCGTELGEQRRFYTTTEAVADLEALRLGLEVDRLSLFGVSYGTYLAQRYATRFPSAVDRLVLDSPVAQDQDGPFDVSSYREVGPVLRRLCAGSRCRGITRDAPADLRALVRKLPLRGRVYNARGRASTLRLSDQVELFDLLVSSDFSPELRAAIPAAVRSAVRGDPAPLLRLLAFDTADPGELDEQPEDPAEFSNALFFATTCQEEPLPWGTADAPLAGRGAMRRAALAKLPARVFSPFGRAAAGSTQVGTTLCERWPPTSVAPVPGPARIHAPALVLSGLMDLRTPTAGARRVAALIPDATLVAVRGAGHSLVSSRLRCVQVALGRFFADESVGNPCAASRAPTPRPAPLAPRRLGAVAAALGVLADSTRLVAAQGLLDRPLAFGGLRGGSVCALPGPGGRSLVLKLHRTVYVPGIAVDGTAVVTRRRIARATLALSGRARGGLSLRGRRVTGRIAGRSVSTTVRRARLAVPRTPIAPSGGRRRCG